MFFFCGCSFRRSHHERGVLCGQTPGRHLCNDRRDDMESDERAVADASSSITAVTVGREGDSQL